MMNSLNKPVPIEDDYEPDTKNQKQKRGDLVKDTRNALKSGGLPPKKEDKPTYVTDKKPLIDEKIWIGIKN